MKEIIKLDSYTIDEVKRFIGHQEENIKILEDTFQTEMIVRGDEIVLNDEDDKRKQIKEVLDALLKLVKQGKTISKRDVMYTLKLSETHNLKAIDELYQIKIARTMSGKLIYPKALGQKEYYYALKNKDVVLGIVPAGTGKTYLSAFDVKKVKPEKMLFIAHRKTIIKKAKYTFESIISNKKMAIYGDEDISNADYIFAMVQTLNKKEHSNKDECAWYHLNLYTFVYLKTLTQFYVFTYMISINILRGYLPFFLLSLHTCQKLS